MDPSTTVVAIEPPPEMSTFEHWIDEAITPFIQFLGSHPKIAFALGVYIAWFVAGTSILLSIRVKYPEDKDTPFGILTLKNLLEISCGNVWRLGRRYWPNMPVKGAE